MSKIDVGGEAAKLRGVAEFGYSPDGMVGVGEGGCKVCTRIYNATVAAGESFQESRKTVVEARANIDGDWFATRAVLKATSWVTGFIFTR